MSVTPAAMSSSFFCCRKALVTSANSVRLLMPRISLESLTCNVSTGSFRRR